MRIICKDCPIMGNFRVGIIGAGHIAEKMALTLNRMEGVEAYGIASRSMEKAERFARLHHVTRAYGSYEALADSPEVDLVYVATPHSLHHPHVRMCLEKGKPVLCEKSFMLDSNEAEDVIRLSEERNIFLAEAIWTRYMPFSKTISEIIGSGRIGRPMMLSARLGYPVAHKERIMNPALGGGALLDLGVYAINFALMTFGNDIKGVTSSCTKAESGVDLQDNICLVYDDGKMAVLAATVLCADDRQAVICGDEGYMTVDNINNPLHAWIWSKDHVLLETIDATAQITGFEYQVMACMDAIREGRIETGFMPHSETLYVMRIMDGLRREWGIRF